MEDFKRKVTLTWVRESTDSTLSVVALRSDEWPETTPGEGWRLFKVKPFFTLIEGEK